MLAVTEMAEVLSPPVRDDRPDGAFEAPGAIPADRVADDRPWDRFVEATFGGDLVQTTMWAQSKRALGFDTCHAIARVGSRILGGALIVIKRLGPLGALGYVARGPLVDPSDAAQLPAVLDEIERAARARRVRHLVIQPPAGGDVISAALAARGYTSDAPAVAPTATLQIDLSHSLEQIFARMARAKRRQIRRSQREGVEVKLGGSDDIQRFHALHEASAHRLGFAPISSSYLRQQWDALHPFGYLRVMLAYHEGRPLAGLWLTAFGDTVTQRLSGWHADGRGLQPNVACCWEAIRWAKEQGYRIYDFGGIDRDYAQRILAEQPLPEAFHRSPAALKRELGSEPVLLPTASQFTFNPIARLLVRSAYGRIGRHPFTRRLVHRLRNG